MQQIYRRTPMPKCDFNKVAKQLMEVLAKGYILLVKSLNTVKCLMRYPNDVKIFQGDIPDHNAVPDNSGNNNDWKKAFEFISNNDYVHYHDSKQNYYTANPTLRRSDRICKPNPRYCNYDFVT